MREFKLFDCSTLERPEIGRAYLEEPYGALQLVSLAQYGHLNVTPVLSEEERAVIEAEQARNEADLADPEAALARIQDEIDAKEAEERKLPEGEYRLEDLRPKQLKALCEQLGLKTYGTREDLQGRIAEYRAAERARNEAATEDVDLEKLDLKGLKKLAKHLGLPVSGSREELMDRIEAALNPADAASE